jgi:hypothetical protein
MILRSNNSVPVTENLSHLRRIYAIGDIHGRLDLLDNVIAQIKDDVTSSERSHALTICH